MTIMSIVLTCGFIEQNILTYRRMKYLYVLTILGFFIFSPAMAGDNALAIRPGLESSGTGYGYFSAELCLKSHSAASVSHLFSIPLFLPSETPSAFNPAEGHENGVFEFMRDHILIIIALLLLVVVFLYTNYRLKKRSNLILLQKNDEILEQKANLEKLVEEFRESQRRKEAILHAIPDLMFVFDKDGNYLSYKVKKPEDLLYSEDVLNKNIRDILPADFAERILEAIRDAAKSRQLQIFEHRMDYQGQIMDIEMRLTLAGKDEFLMMARDITSRKKMEEDLHNARREAEEATRIKSMFLASLSHEIRTPLSSIIGITSVLEETNLDPEQQEYIDIINMSGNNLLNLINNILDFSKIESGQIEIENLKFDFEAILDEVISILKLKARESNNKISKEIDPKIPKKIISDPVRLQQILINLISNANKFTRDGRIQVKAELLERFEDKLRIKVNIIDDGIGVSEEQKTKIFRAFSQADASIARNYGGTGLGLTIAKQFTNLMGGEIGVESEAGKGANFWFTIVTNDEENENSEKSEPSSQIKNDHMKALRILLVEDNLLNQKFAIAILKKYHHRIDIAVNGKEGVERFMENKYDLILMDIQMPVMDGIEATKIIRRYEKKKNLEPTRIVAVTAYAMEGDEERFYKAGIDDYLRKPYRADQLINMIDKES